MFSPPGSRICTISRTALGFRGWAGMSRLKTLPPRIPTMQGRLTSSGPSWRAGKRGANQLGYTYRWQVQSSAFLREHPLCECEECQGGRVLVTLAQVVDHRIPHRGDRELFWNKKNWQSMSIKCHNKKSAREQKDFEKKLLTGGIS